MVGRQFPSQQYFAGRVQRPQGGKGGPLATSRPSSPRDDDAQRTSSANRILPRPPDHALKNLRYLAALAQEQHFARRQSPAV